MQRDLDALIDWGSTWGMKFNAKKKCNIMRVSRSCKPLQHFYSLSNEILQEVSDAKYLGIQIDNIQIAIASTYRAWRLHPEMLSMAGFGAQLLV